MSNVARRQRDQRTGSETEIECDELQFLTEEEEESGRAGGWRRLLKTFPAQPVLAPVAPTFSLHDLAQTKAPSGGDERAAAAAAGAPSTLAGHVMWKLAARMSSRNEGRLLQHLSRSIFSHGSNKQDDRFQLDCERGDSSSSSTQSKSRKTGKSVVAGPRESEDKVRRGQVMDSDAVARQDTRPLSSSGATAAAMAGAASASSASGAGILPPMPPLVFSPSKGRVHKQARSMTLEQYTKWTYTGLRPGFSVRVVRCEAAGSMPPVTEYVLHVVDLHTRVFWITKKRFSDFYFLRRKIRAMIRRAPEGDDEEKDYLRFLLDLPFPRRRFRPASAAAVTRGIGEIEVFLRNLAALEPHSCLQRSILMELQLEMCSAEFVSSLEKIDTTGEPVEPKWLAYDLFRRLNCDGAIEGSTCYRFLHVFRNRVATIETAVGSECNEAEGTMLAASAVKDLRNTVTSIEKYIAENLDPQYAETLSLLGHSTDVSSVLDDCVYHAVEDTVLVPLENQVNFLVGKTVDKDVEQRLALNIERLRCRSQIDSGIPEHLQSDEDWGLSCHHLSMIDERTLPTDKIQELLRSALEIFKSCGEKNLEWHDNSALTADEYLPIHIYVVVKSGLKRPLATKELLGSMIHPSLMLGEVGYFLTMFEVALKYIADM